MVPNASANLVVGTSSLPSDKGKEAELGILGVCPILRDTTTLSCKRPGACPRGWHVAVPRHGHSSGFVGLPHGGFHLRFPGNE